MTKVAVAFQAKDQLGEGPVWSVAEQALYWVDILEPALQRWQPGSAEHTVWRMPSEIGSYALAQDGGAIVALRDGLYRFHFDSGDLALICRPEPAMETRFNDGKCDRHGRFWAGTMDMVAKRKIGSLYWLGSNGQCRRQRQSIGISNGLGWSPDNRTMYFTDTLLQKIFAFDYNIETGEMANERVFAEDSIGFPDGLTVDAEGYIWSAKWDGWRVVRYAADGQIERIIEMPVQRPTSCVFGGPDLNILYITSARVDLTAEKLANQSGAGSIFALETETAGFPEPLFAG